MLCLNLQPRSDGVTLKDTFVNMPDTGEFVYNMVTLEQAHQMHRTAFEFPPEADEFVEVGLEKAPSVVVRAPRVLGAPISMECRVHKIISVGEIVLCRSKSRAATARDRADRLSLGVREFGIAGLVQVAGRSATRSLA
jgi:flavin reductase (DIM6/NTAB) family NADH-FMN oxidoreductase RutF